MRGRGSYAAPEPAHQVKRVVRGGRDGCLLPSPQACMLPRAYVGCAGLCRSLTHERELSRMLAPALEQSTVRRVAQSSLLPPPRTGKCWRGFCHRRRQSVGASKQRATCCGQVGAEIGRARQKDGFVSREERKDGLLMRQWVQADENPRGVDVMPKNARL